MWLADGMIAVELAGLIAGGSAIVGFALGCFLMEDKLFRRMYKGASWYKDKPQNAPTIIQPKIK
jgi:hypothetical protein